MATKKETELEMEPLEGSSDMEKSRRFQVNKVNSDLSGNHVMLSESEVDGADFMGSEDDDELININDRIKLNSETETKYVKSFRQLTRDALPRLENYRNILSFQAANRPTLDELHNATLLNKSQTQIIAINGKISEFEGQIKFGWIQGVLVRCLLNIWGVMLFLRLSWVVGQAGVVEAVVLIILTSCVTTVTALSMSAISTNGVIKGGGTYYMISRSLGPEFGGSIGLIFSMANAVACAMYVVGFCESMRDLLKSFNMKIIDAGVQDIRVIGTITIIVLLIIVVVGMEWEAKAQNVLLAVLLVAMLDYFVGSFIGPTTNELKAKGFLGYNITVLKDNLYPDYRYSKSEGIYHNFFSVFSVFFPAATGILAGANISGDLKDPSKAIPKGTLLAIILTTTSYIFMAFVAGFCVVRDASGNVTEFLEGTFTNCTNRECVYGLQNSFQVIELVSWVGPIIYAGCFAATLSSALASLISAPKVFQALCKDKLYPYIEWFAKGYGQNNEPIRGYILTFFISLCFILIGELNIIAPLISNFFLAAYTLINFSTFHASLAKPVGWRPTFRYYNMWLSLLGSILCVLVMFLISWWTALLTFSVVLALYLFVSYRKPDVNWGSTTQAQIYKNALQAVHQLSNIEEHVKNYRPQILVLSGMPSARPALVDFSSLLTKNLSMLICGHINTSVLPERVRSVLSYKASLWLKTHKIKSFYTQVDGVTFEEGAKALLKASGIGKLKPNILLMGHKADWQKCSKQELDMYFEVLHMALDLHLAIAILRLQQGLEMIEILPGDDVFPNAQIRSGSIEFVPRFGSFDQISEVSSTSNKSTPEPRKKMEIVSTNPFPEEESKIKRSNDSYPQEDRINYPKDISSQMFQFQKKQKRGTIDVWWLYDDGGLTLLLPHIMRTRRNWSACTLRVFTLANKRNELEFEQRNMASMLAKFRINYSDLHIVTDVTSKPQDSTQELFNSLIADFRQASKHPNGAVISESELISMEEKTNRHLRLRELLLEHSHDASFVVMTLPVPRKHVISAPLYLAWLELLTKDMPPFLLVRGNQTSVLTFYS